MQVHSKSQQPVFFQLIAKLVRLQKNSLSLSYPQLTTSLSGLLEKIFDFNALKGSNPMEVYEAGNDCLTIALDNINSIVLPDALKYLASCKAESEIESCQWRSKSMFKEILDDVKNENKQCLESKDIPRPLIYAIQDVITRFNMLAIETLEVISKDDREDGKD